MTSINQTEKQEFKNQGGVSDYLQDLKYWYYGLKASNTSLSELDRERAFLKKMTGLTCDSMHDLWRAYFISKGMTDILSLGDMRRDFFENLKFQGDIEFDNIRVSEAVTVWKSIQTLSVADSVNVAQAITVSK